MNAEIQRAIRAAIAFAALGLFCVLAWSLSGCTRNPPALRGGNSTAYLGGISAHLGSQVNPTSATLTQPENPAATSAQTIERTETQQTTAPAPLAQRVTESPDVSGNGYTTRVTETFAPPPVLTHTVSEKTGTTLGAAHRDESRTISAKLASFRPVQFAGLAFLAVALASFHPAVRLIIGAGKTIPALAAACGLVLIFGPSLFVGNESTALVIITVAVFVAYLLVRTSHKEAIADTLSRAPPPVKAKQR